MMKQAHKQTLWILFILIIGILSTQSGHALGIAPSSQSIVFEPGATHDLQLKVVNSEQRAQEVIVYVEGELEPYVTMDQSKLVFQEGESEKKITLTLTLPESFAKQGIHESSIVVRQVSAAGAPVQARVAVQSSLKVVVPYTGKYLIAKLFVPNMNLNQESNFIVETENLGTEDIVAARTVIEILGPTGEQIDFITSPEQPVPSKGKAHFTLKWTPQVQPGQYEARARIIYDDQNVEDSKTFNIGQPKVVIKHIDVSNFRLGSIAKFDIYAENQWNRQLQDVYATAEIEQEGKTIASSQTESITIDPYEVQELNAYWDTASRLPGKYLLKAKIFFMDTYTEETIDLAVEQDRIQTGALGQVTGNEATEENKLLKAVYIIIGLVVLLIALNVFIIMRKKNKN